MLPLSLAGHCAGSSRASCSSTLPLPVGAISFNYRGTSAHHVRNVVVRESDTVFLSRPIVHCGRVLSEGSRIPFLEAFRCHNEAKHARRPCNNSQNSERTRSEPKRAPRPSKPIQHSDHGDPESGHGTEKRYECPAFGGGLIETGVCHDSGPRRSNRCIAPGCTNPRNTL